MRILVKLVLDVDADAAWRALHSPTVLEELYGPLMRIDPGDTPLTWEPGSEAVVRMSVAGAVPMGLQLIHASDRTVRDASGPVRIFRDSGIPLTGPLAALDVWDHQMAVSPAPGDPSRTLWRERLTIGGLAAPVLWPALWATWQWRSARSRALAPTWAFNPEASTLSD